MRKLEMLKTDIFSHACGHEKLQCFFHFLKSLSFRWKLPPQLTTGHLKCEYLPIWMRNMLKCQIPRTVIFSQVSGHGKLQFFRLSEKPFKMTETTTS